MKNNISTSEIVVGVVGLGLMGSSVATALLISGHRVKAIAPLSADMQFAHRRLADQLAHCERAGLLSEKRDFYERRVTVSEDYSQLSSCRVVLECVVEDIDTKAVVYKKITDVVTCDAIIASNTSAIPISDLQRHVKNPDRFLGIHWAEPAYMTRFLEITCGQKTSAKYATWVFDLAHEWGKEPTLLRKDIRGFVTNRLMYAIYREMFAVIANGHATIEDVDKAFRYDVGSWITLMGIFRRMDYLGLNDLQRTFENLFPLLCNDTDVPTVMKHIVAKELKGTQDAGGLYEYTHAEAKAWGEAFARFNEDIYKLAARYPLLRGRSERKDRD